ncbi:amidohydrolase [Sinorhizobium fredii USDA 205]|uniref:Amidohydrolase n=1 Tax=Rhizobium fredii TaxID=380 RepID=A0A2A6LUL8_RHIFR|nr:amidohydrolase family protein [Sinorhizobium fredii]ASY70975.1 L-fuconolactone hydrolase [Sinorhizobium fredii CCBAU 83666]AWM27039.1 L-fuconolactone hydrolase [Sinorhizobium fredii CCBAU 25509]KSV87027.1 amidohydrolase [Sinorhizobium fredii USDA 205]MCG5475033.1 amidohydrolase family protein [Sinorhizobium fredii]MQW99128.1 amidohydrolase family protein [Sinorhizobium fredii]
MSFIDSHQHYWTLGLGHNDWPGPDLAPIFRDFGPDDLKPHLTAAGIGRTVLVQAAPNVAETEFLLEIAAREETVAAVVGWVDILAADAGSELRRLKTHPKFKGIRPMLQGIDETAWILQPEAIATLELLPQIDLRFDALIQPRHLPVIAALADRLPDLAIVVDHGAKPFIAEGRLEPWATDMAALARRPNVHVKLSGLVTEAGGGWSVERLRPYAAHLIEVFGAERVMFGSDWPVVLLDAGYAEWFAAARALTANCTEAERQAIFLGTAARFYGISAV